jgi:tRNA pseudouridine55 synthase
LSEPQQAPTGILVVDKPEGPTSHDVVAWARRAFGTRTVGHAGTLDPFASGVLVVLVGEATKLAGYATAEDKRYRTEIALGEETDTLDREGNVVRSAEVPPLERAAIEAAIEALRGEPTQVPPAISAIKKDGVRHYERARRGEDVPVEPRPVVLHEAALESIGERTLTVSLRCGKGFYVRSFGRDLAARLGTVGHLRTLRRLSSGRYDLSGALDGEELRRASRGDLSAQARASSHRRPITAASVPLPPLTVDEALAAELRCGKKPAIDRAPDLGAGPHLAFDLEGRPVAIVEAREGRIRVLRGIGG